MWSPFPSRECVLLCCCRSGIDCMIAFHKECWGWRWPCQCAKHFPFMSWEHWVDWDLDHCGSTPGALADCLLVKARACSQRCCLLRSLWEYGVVMVSQFWAYYLTVIFWWVAGGNSLQHPLWIYMRKSSQINEDIFVSLMQCWLWAFW